MKAAIPSEPRLNDPVVVDGHKYRIRTLGVIGVVLHDRFGGGVRPNGPVLAIERLVWDPIPAVWRVRP